MYIEEMLAHGIGKYVVAECHLVLLTMFVNTANIIHI